VTVEVQPVNGDHHALSGHGGTLDDARGPWGSRGTRKKGSDKEETPASKNEEGRSPAGRRAGAEGDWFHLDDRAACFRVPSSLVPSSSIVSSFPSWLFPPCVACDPPVS